MFVNRIKVSLVALVLFAGVAHAGVKTSGTYWVDLSTGGIGNYANGASAVSITAWVTFNGNTSTTFGPILNVWQNSNTFVGIDAYQDGVNGLLICGARSTFSDTFQGTPGFSYVVGTNYFIACVLNFGNKTIQEYINGVLTQNVSALGWTSTTYTNGSPTAADQIGAAGPTFPANATISDLRVYNTALNAFDITNLYSSRQRQPYLTESLIGYWTLDDAPPGGSIGIVFDHSKFVNSGQPQSGIIWTGEAVLNYP